jgi:hypothetical protein
MKGSVSGIRAGKQGNIIPGPIRLICFSKKSVSIRIYFSNKPGSVSRCKAAAGSKDGYFSIL